MPFPGNVNRYVLSGTLPGSERWAVGFYGAPTAAGTAQGLADGFDDAGSLTLAMLTQLRAINPAEFSILRVQVYIYGTGRTILDQGDAALSLAGSATGTRNPNQTSMVMTLRTAVRSRRGRGRMYLPALAAPIQSNGVYDTTRVQATVNAVGAALDNLSARVVSESAGTSNEVNRVDADLIPDVQRGRVDKMTSTRLGYNFV